MWDSQAARGCHWGFAGGRGAKDGGLSVLNKVGGACSHEWGRPGGTARVAMQWAVHRTQQSLLVGQEDCQERGPYRAETAGKLRQCQSSLRSTGADAKQQVAHQHKSDSNGYPAGLEELATSVKVQQCLPRCRGQARMQRLHCLTLHPAAAGEPLAWPHCTSLAPGCLERSSGSPASICTALSHHAHGGTSMLSAKIDLRTDSSSS